MNDPTNMTTPATTPAVGAPMDHSHGNARLPGVEAQIREDVHRRQDPEHSKEHEELLVDRARKQVACTGAVVLAEGSTTMTAAQSALADRAEALAYRAGRERRAERIVEALRRTWAALPRGLTLRRELLLALCALTVGAVATLGIQTLSAEALHFYVTRALYDALRVAPHAAFEIARRNALVIAAAAVAPLVVVVVACRGRLAGWLKGLFVAAEVGFAVGFATTRLSGAGWTPAAKAFAALEIAVALAEAAAILGLARHLAEEREMARAWEVARRQLAAAERSLAEAVGLRRSAELAYAAQVAAIQRREEEIVDRERRDALAAPTASAAYQVALGELYAALSDGAPLEAAPAGEPRRLSVVQDG